MKTIIVQHGQSMIDIALQEAGTVEAVFEIAGANSITDLFKPGLEIEVLSQFKKEDKAVQRDYARKNTQPATALLGLEGIGYQTVPILIY